MLNASTQPRASSPGWVFLAGAVIVAVLIGVESIPALAIVLLEGTVALAVLAAAGLVGGWVVGWLGLKDAPLAERLILGAAVGIGSLSLAVLGLGAAGWLSKGTAFALAGVAAVAGVVRLGLDVRRMNREPRPDAAEPGGQRWNWLWLVVCPFAAMVLLAACLPPGVLWREEGYGYDVLEYHLAVPKIFWEQGRITFLASNAYSNFPLNSEMLSLLMMTLRGDAVEAAYMTVTVNVGLGALFAAGAWLIGRRFSRMGGLAAGILAATAPWIAYLAGIAYVEVGMMAMGACALAAVLPVQRGERKLAASPFVGGLLAGVACGFKYTAVPLLALPVGLAILASGESWSRRLRNLLIYGCGAAITFSPWLVRNVVNTGNPVFPLAYSVFGDRSGTWSRELDAQWQRAHGSAQAERTEESAVARVWARTGGDFRLGAATFALAAIGAFRRRDRWTAALAAMLIVQFGVWLTATHLFARFAVVMILPALALASRAFDDANPTGSPRDGGLGRGATLGLMAVLSIGCAWNLGRLGQLYYEHTRPGGVAVAAYGQIDWFRSGQWPGTAHWGAINALPENARVMLVGEARTYYLRPGSDYAVVFNRQPLAEAAEKAGAPAEVLVWLRQRGITHVLVDWAEIGRLSETYGFPQALSDPEFYRGLVAAGLKPLGQFRFLSEDTQPYATLFEVPPP